MNKLQAVRYQAAYAQLAQKLDMHIKNFDSDPNTQIRWVWQLIQNAKDAPNVFKQTKIKQQVDDHYFTSSHNGDAFQINQLHSVVAQYSTKKQKNSELTKTTGKYGTGFITTYILSKILELEGILKVEIDNQSDSQNEQENDSDSDLNDQQNQQDCLINHKLLRKIKSQKLKSSKYKNDQKISRLIKLQLKNKSYMDIHEKKMKSSHIRKKRRNKDLEKRKNKLIFQKQFERLKLEEQIEYENEMKLLELQLADLSTSDDNELKQFQNRTNFHKKDKKTKKKKNKVSLFYYKKFNIPMDRSYVDRDQQLPKKIQKTQKRLTKIVLEAQYQSTHNPDYSTRQYYDKQRTADSYDTTFKYKIVDKKKFQMIQRTMINVKQLVPYAFLFNDNLTYYQFTDKRTVPKQNLSFSITKGQIAQIEPNIYLFTYQVQQNYDQKNKRFLVKKVQYIVAYFSKGKAIAAVPVKIQNNLIQIIKVDPKVPKYFKDFPLIGCSDTKWNAIVNARQFYPNEKRSELMLSYIDQTNRSKVQTNWQHLNACFFAVKQIYVFLSHHCLVGLQNLLIFSSENNVSNERAQFKVHLTNLIKQIAQTKFIPNRLSEKDINKNTVEPKKLVFIESASRDDQIYNKDKKNHYNLSYRANQAFSFLFGQNVTLSSEYYKDFYQILHYKSSQRMYLQQNMLISFLSVNDCLRKMETLTLQNFCVRLKGNYMDKLNQIYTLLKDYNQQAYFSLSKPSNFDFKIILNEKVQFMRLQRDHMMFNSLPDVYHELAEKLGIHVKQNLIHKQFAKYIKENDKKYCLGIEKMEDKILRHFTQYSIEFTDEKRMKVKGQNDLKKMFSLLLTFKSISLGTIKLIKKFVDFEKVQGYQLKQNIKQLHKLRQPVQKQLLNVFIRGFMVYFESTIRYSPILKDQLQKKLTIKNYEQAIDFLKQLFEDKLLGLSLGLITFKLNWSGVFVQQNTLCALNEGVKYPLFQDIQIYNIVYTIKLKEFNSCLFNRNRLQDRLVNPIYPRASLKNIKNQSYANLYSQLINHYSSDYHITQQQRYQILSYAAQINDKYKAEVKVDIVTAQKLIKEKNKVEIKLDLTIVQKYKAWQRIIQQRLNRLYDIVKDKKQYNDESTKNFIYKLLDNKQQLKNAKMIFENNGGKLYFTDLCLQLNLIKSDQKKEQAKNVKK